MRTLRWSILALVLSWLVGPHSVFAYLVTGGRIVDAQGQAVQLRGVNWFGFKTTDHVAHGLWARSWKSLLEDAPTRLGHRLLKAGRLLREALPLRRTEVAEHILRRYLDEAYLRQVLDAGLAGRLREKRFGR